MLLKSYGLKHLQAKAIRGFDGYCGAGRVIEQRVSFPEHPAAPGGKHAGGRVNLPWRCAGCREERGHAPGGCRIHAPATRANRAPSRGRSGANPCRTRLRGVLNLGDADLLFEALEHGFVEPNLGGPLHQCGHQVDLVLELEQRVEQVFGTRRAAGDIHVDGHDFVDALEDLITSSLTPRAAAASL